MDVQRSVIVYHTGAMERNTAIRDACITFFVAAWLLLYSYETLRLNYLSPLFHRELPKTKFLFPPAGWIMFYEVGEREGHVEVYGLRDRRPELIDPHRIFATRWLGYDNIHRNVMISVLSRAYAESFCRFLRRKFPDYDGFIVAYAETPSVVEQPQRVFREVMYQCP